MSKSFNPLDWYWLTPDGKSVYGSKSETIAPLTDADFAAWSADGSQPTLWPRDDSGAQTDAAMQAVLAAYGLALPGAAAVPASVSSAQAKIQCLRTPGSATGKTLLDDIAAAVTGEAAIWFSDARTWERSNPYVASLSAGLKLTSAQVDALFIAAAKIAA